MNTYGNYEIYLEKPKVKKSWKPLSNQMLVFILGLMKAVIH